MVRLSDVAERNNAKMLLQDLREAYNVLDTFSAFLKDSGDEELAVRISRVINTVDDCSNFLNDFVKTSGVVFDDGFKTVPIVDTDMKTEGRKI